MTKNKIEAYSVPERPSGQGDERSPECPGVESGSVRPGILMACLCCQYIKSGFDTFKTYSLKQKIAVICLFMACLAVTICLFLMGTCVYYNCNDSDILCTNLPPGLSKIAQGVDITTLDLYPVKVFESQGLKSPILNFTCNKGRTWTSISGKEYQYPDQMTLMTSHDENWTPAEVNIFQSDNDIRSWMNENVGGENSIFNFSFSGSPSFKKMQITITNSSKFIEDVFSFKLTSEFDFVPTQDLKLGRFVEKYVDRFLTGTFETNRVAYENFILEFGTHYFSTADFGGIIRSYLETNKSYVNSKTEQEIINEAKATFINSISMNGGTISGSTFVSESTFSNIRYYGGDQNASLISGIQQWQSTIDNDPWLISGQLKPIVDLISDKNKKRNLLKAIQQHVLRSFLEGLLGVVATERDTLGGYAILNTLENRIETMQGIDTLAEGQVEALGSDVQQELTDLKKAIEEYNRRDLEELLRLVSAAKEKLNHPILDALANRIEAVKGMKPLVKNDIDTLKTDVSYHLTVPSWFMDNTKLCYSWWGDGDWGQCGGGAATLLCALPNSKTPYYRDDTDRRRGGCRMRWGIMAVGYPDWFGAVRVCFRWYPDGDGGQCGNGVGRHLCAPLNKYTSAYRDDTDRRKGGCRMSWMIDVPDSAPLWMKTTKLCYYWYADGDWGQCGGGASTTLCATSDHWTSYYRDDSDRRKGGCRMSWGLTLLL